MQLFPIVVGVVSLHLILVAVIGAEIDFESAKPLPTQKLVARTIKLSQPHLETQVVTPELEVQQQATESIAQTASIINEELVFETPSISVPKPIESVTKTKKKTAPSPLRQPAKVKKIETAKPPAKPAVKKEFLEAACASMAKVALGRVKSSSGSSVKPLKIGDLSVDATGEPAYEQRLVDTLRSGLILPEVGEVKIRLRVSRSGEVIGLEVLKAKSQRNRQYIESELRLMKMPIFGTHFSGMKDTSFVLQLTNE